MPTGPHSALANSNSAMSIGNDHCHYLDTGSYFHLTQQSAPFTFERLPWYCGYFELSAQPSERRLSRYCRTLCKVQGPMAILANGLCPGFECHSNEPTPGAASLLSLTKLLPWQAHRKTAVCPRFFYANFGCGHSTLISAMTEDIIEWLLSTSIA